MTEQKITLELTLDELKMLDKHVEYSDETKEIFDKIKQAYPQPRMEFGYRGNFEIVSYNGEEYLRLQFNDESYNWFKRKHTADGGVLMISITDNETYRLLEGLWFNQVKKGVLDEPTKPMDEVVNRLVEKYQAQKLWNIMKDKWGFSEAECNDIVEGVEDWLPEPQSSAGSQNVNTELLVEGFNDCVRKMKEMMR